MSATSEQAERFAQAANALAAVTVMRPLTETQRAQLASPLPRDVIRRKPGKAAADYVDGHYIIERLNTVFGPDGWEPFYEPAVVREGERAVITVRGYLRAMGVTKWDVGVGIAANASPDSFETAFKGAHTDCLKRCARTLGDSFGLALYEKVLSGQQRSGVGISTTAMALLDELELLETVDAINAWVRANAPAVAKLDHDEQDIIKGDCAARRRACAAPAPVAPKSESPPHFEEPADRDAPAPDAPHLQDFPTRVAEIDLPGEAVAVWIKFLPMLRVLSATGRDAAWKTLCAKTAAVGKMARPEVWLSKALTEEGARCNLDVLLPAAPEPSFPALDSYRARVAACASIDELVAVRLSANNLRTLPQPAQVTAKELTRERVVALGITVPAFGQAITAAEKISTDPAHWIVMAEALGGLRAALNGAELKLLVKTLAAKASGLPEGLRTALNAARLERIKQLDPQTTAKLPRNEHDELLALIEKATTEGQLKLYGARLQQLAATGKITQSQADALGEAMGDAATRLGFVPVINGQERAA